MGVVPGEAEVVDAVSKRLRGSDLPYVDAEIIEVRASAEGGVERHPVATLRVSRPPS
jgi:hypothetical protein